jgi:hypothetical protein
MKTSSWKLKTLDLKDEVKKKAKRKEVVPKPMALEGDEHI